MTSSKATAGGGYGRGTALPCPYVFVGLTRFCRFGIFCPAQTLL